MDPYRSLPEADAKMLARLELEDAIATFDEALLRLARESRSATALELPSIREHQRRVAKHKAVLVRKLADDSFYIPRAERAGASREAEALFLKHQIRALKKELGRPTD